MLDPVKAFFLHSSNELAVNDNRRTGVTVVGVDSENYHKCISDFGFRIADLQQHE